ncbi:MAG: SWIM zinc finger family protein, partial [Geodermatophilaceae bacterium]
MGLVAADDADLVSALLAFEPRIEVARLGAESGLPEDRVVRALGRLGAAGRVGYDAAEGAYFHRELPYDSELLTAMHPRLRSAADLVETGAARVDGAIAYVRGGDSEHVIRGTAEGAQCTCPWFAKHKGSRGPCKHVLA